MTIAFLLSLAAAGQPKNLPEPKSYGDRITVRTDIPYAKDAQDYQKMDVYVPRGDKGPLPLVVCLYGGGFIGGNKEGMGRICSFLASRGFVAAAPNYFLTPREGKQPAWPQNLYDAKCAVRFLRAHATEYRIDPKRVAVLGNSAGAYLSLMVAFTSDRDDLKGPGGWDDRSSGVTCVVSIAGVTDRRSDKGPGTIRLLGADHEHKPKLQELASPLAHVRSASPPVYMLHGTADATVPVENAHRLTAALKKLGVAHQLDLVANAGHNPRSPERLATIADWLAEQFRR